MPERVLKTSRRTPPTRNPRTIRPSRSSRWESHRDRACQHISRGPIRPRRTAKGPSPTACPTRVFPPPPWQGVPVYRRSGKRHRPRSRSSSGHLVDPVTLIFFRRPQIPSFRHARDRNSDLTGPPPGGTRHPLPSPARRGLGLGDGWWALDGGSRDAMPRPGRAVAGRRRGTTRPERRSAHALGQPRARRAAGPTGTVPGPSLPAANGTSPQAGRGRGARRPGNPGSGPPTGQVPLRSGPRVEGTDATTEGPAHAPGRPPRKPGLVPVRPGPALGPAPEPGSHSAVRRWAAGRRARAAGTPRPARLRRQRSLPCKPAGPGATARTSLRRHHGSGTGSHCDADVLERHLGQRDRISVLLAPEELQAGAVMKAAARGRPSTVGTASTPPPPHPTPASG